MGHRVRRVGVGPGFEEDLPGPTGALFFIVRSVGAVYRVVKPESQFHEERLPGQPPDGPESSQRVAQVLPGVVVALGVVIGRQDLVHQARRGIEFQIPPETVPRCGITLRQMGHPIGPIRSARGPVQTAGTSPRRPPP